MPADDIQYSHAKRVGRFAMLVYAVIAFLVLLVLLLLMVLTEDYRRVRQRHYDEPEIEFNRATGLCPKCNGTLSYRNGLPSCVACGQMWWKT